MYQKLKDNKNSSHFLTNLLNSFSCLFTSAPTIQSACEANDVTQLQQLITHMTNFELNRCDEFGMTPLHLCVLSDSILCAEYLLKDKKVNPNIKSTDGYLNATALHIASNRRNIDMVKLLLIHGADPKIIDKRGQTPFSENQTKDLIYLINEVKSAKENAASSNFINSFHPSH